MSSYAIISVGGKQYRVREGERLLVGGDGETKISPTDVTVTARIVANTRGEKIRIGKYRPKNGYKKHTGFRASLSQIEIESIGGGKRSKPKQEPAKKAAPAAKAEAPAAAADRVKGMPAGYEELTVAEIKAQATDWNRPMLEAALEYEGAHAKRKGALAAIESALAEKEEDS